ncbi:MAG: O-antigen ligase family protein [Pseudomonadales bacterium]
MADAFLGGRFRGYFENPNNIGLICSLCVPLCFFRYLTWRRKKDFFLLVIFMVSMAAAGTRSALGAAGIAVMFMLISHFVHRPARAFYVAFVSCAALFSFFQTEFFVRNVLREETLSTRSDRSFFWELAEKYVEVRPLFGHGFGVEKYIHAEYGINLDFIFLRGYGVMSSYYGAEIELGWPMAYLMFFLLIMFSVWMVVLGFRNLFLMSLGGTILGGLFLCIFESALFAAGGIFSFMFWLVVMLAVRERHNHRVGWNRVNTGVTRLRGWSY